MARIPSRLFWLSALLFLAFSCLLDAANLKDPILPQGDLGVRLDRFFAMAAMRGPKKKIAPDHRFRWLFSTYLEFNEGVASIKAEQLHQMALDAHREMQNDIEQWDVEYNEDGGIDVIPTVMTILAWDNKIILSSSQKGASGFIDSLPDSPVKKDIDICQAAFAAGTSPGKNKPKPAKNGQTPDHKYGRKCGEVYAFHHYYQLSDTPIKSLDPKARVLAVGTRFFPGNARYMDPCGTGSKTDWGCDITVAQVGAQVIPKVGTQSYDLKEIAGGLKRRGQIQSCAKNQIHWLPDLQ